MVDMDFEARLFGGAVGGCSTAVGAWLLYLGVSVFLDPTGRFWWDVTAVAMYAFVGAAFVTYGVLMLAATAGWNAPMTPSRVVDRPVDDWERRENARHRRRNE